MCNTRRLVGVKGYIYCPDAASKHQQRVTYLAFGPNCVKIRAVTSRSRELKVASPSIKARQSGSRQYKAAKLFLVCRALAEDECDAECSSKYYILVISAVVTGSVRLISLM